MRWDNKRFESLEDVTAIEIKRLAGRHIAFYYPGNDDPTVGKVSGKIHLQGGLVLIRDPEKDIKTFIVWARGVAQACGLFPVIGLH